MQHCSDYLLCVTHDSYNLHVCNITGLFITYLRLRPSRLHVRFWDVCHLRYAHPLHFCSHYHTFVAGCPVDYTRFYSLPGHTFGCHLCCYALFTGLGHIPGRLPGLHARLPQFWFTGYPTHYVTIERCILHRDVYSYRAGSTTVRFVTH